MTGQNLLTLWSQAVPPEKIPVIPGVKLLRALGGEQTWFIEQELPISDSRVKVVLGSREAEEGELLRGPDLRYCPDWDDNLRWRIGVSAAAEKDPSIQDLHLRLCKSSLLYFAATFVWIYDPWADEDKKQIPFVPFDFQADVLTWMVWLHKNKTSGIIEKSREMGATWMLIVFYVWLTIFYPGTTVYLTSLRDEDVDNRQPDSLMGKYRYVMERLPEWMRMGWVSEGPGDKYSLIALKNGSFVRGQKTESTGGRQGRASSLGADEFAFITDAGSVLAAFSRLAPTIIYISTPNGMGNEFARMAHDPGAEKKSLHWRIHPFKNPESQRLSRSDIKYHDDATWNREEEIDYQGSVTGRVFPGLIHLPLEGAPWHHVRDDEIASYEEAYDVYSSTDLGRNDPCATLWAQIKPAPPELAEYTLWTLVIFAEHEARNMLAADLRYLLNSRVYPYKDHIVDMRTGQQGDSSGSTWISRLADKDARPEYSRFYKRITHPGPPIIATGKRNWEQPTIDQVRAMLAMPGAIAINKDACPRLVTAIQNWAYPLDKETGQPRTESSPDHSPWSHICKSLCYLVDWVYDQFTGDQRPSASHNTDWNFSTQRRRFL